MEPQRVLIPPELRDIERDALRKVTEIYLSIAYPTGNWPGSVGRRLSWMEEKEGQVDLRRPPFEPTLMSGSDKSGIISLRLGNHRYPHMKLQVQPWNSREGYLVSVNTHDQVLAPSPDSPEAEAFRELQAENLRIKLAIESAWEAAGLPTFLGYLRGYLREEGEDRSRPEEGTQDPS